jgi:hypothetical protein
MARRWKKKKEGGKTKSPHVYINSEFNEVHDIKRLEILHWFLL